MATSVRFTRSKDHVQTDIHQKIVIEKTKVIKSELLLLYGIMYSVRVYYMHSHFCHMEYHCKILLETFHHYDLTMYVSPHVKIVMVTIDGRTKRIQNIL